MKALLLAVINIKPINTLLFEFRPTLQNKLLGFVTVSYLIKSDNCSEWDKIIITISADSIFGKFNQPIV